MNQAYRDEFYHYFNVKPGQASEEWEREGEGVESLAVSMNTNVEQFKTILSRNADATFKNYQIQSAVSGKRVYRNDPIYKFLRPYYRRAEAVETTYLEIDAGEKSENGSYEAQKYNVLIVFDEFLGEDAVISYTIFIKGKPILGTVTIVDKKPVFVETL